MLVECIDIQQTKTAFTKRIQIRLNRPYGVFPNDCVCPTDFDDGTTSKCLNRYPVGTGISTNPSHFYGWWFLCLDDVLADSVADQFRYGTKAQLSHDRGAVSLNSLDADSQRVGGFLVGFSIS